MKNVREVPERPREGPRAMVQSSGEKYFPSTFIIFARNNFPVMRNRGGAGGIWALPYDSQFQICAPPYDSQSESRSGGAQI